MRTGAAAGYEGYYHEAVYYSSDEELLAVVVPFLLGGVEAGEPTVVSLGARNAGLLREALGDVDGIVYQSGGAVYARPAAAIRSYQQLLRDYVAQGAGQIRIIGEIPPEGLGAAWDWWARYEAAINVAYDDYPLWSMCAYDTRSTPAPVLADVARTHPRSAEPGGVHRPSPAYAGAEAFLREARLVEADPLEAGAPVVDLRDPMPAEARRALLAANRTDLSVDDLEDFLVAVSEVVTNSLEHGLPPVRLRCWSTRERCVVTVADGGHGPEDPFAGLLPAAKAPHGGLGLWLAHQLCDHVTFGRGRDGEFVVRLTAGRLPG
ncbi:anti-sigma factor RsbA family regulatory protein [Amycolatopsis sacchari]|uniref:anti-sigma factor RsbA family regulatory protein n=1 Tax=Amycolatopsis sacchari TaxID=115433 RepID=UPI003D7071C7